MHGKLIVDMSPKVTCQSHLYPLQVLFDVFVHLPFMYFPAFYTVKEFVQGTSNNPIDW